jgi:hypothetical protein
MVGLWTVVAKTIATVARGEKQRSFRSTFMLILRDAEREGR